MGKPDVSGESDAGQIELFQNAIPLIELIGRHSKEAFLEAIKLYTDGFRPEVLAALEQRYPNTPFREARALVTD